MPRKRTAQRVYIWRKLKRLQALLIDGAIWVLPATPRTREEFQWLAAEIIELGGQATLWEAHALQVGRDQSLQDEFLDQANARYRKLLDELGQGRYDLALLARRYRQIKAQDYFDSELGQRVREALLFARRRLSV